MASQSRQLPPVNVSLAFLSLLLLLLPSGQVHGMALGAQGESEPELEDSAASDQWVSSVTQAIQGSEYSFASKGETLWSAANRAQDLRCSVSAAGLQVAPRRPELKAHADDWGLWLETTAFGRLDNLQPTRNAAVSAAGERIEIDHGSLIEWFINDSRGIEQGWTISERPAGSEKLVIGLTAKGGLTLRVGAGGRAGVFVDAAGEQRLGYGGLLAWDANGRLLDVTLSTVEEGASGRFEVYVEDRDAVYPITVDPLVTNADWTVEIEQLGACYGLSVASAGDVNGDGFSDVIVGAPFYDNGEDNEGRAYVYLGSATGLAQVEAWTAESNQAFGSFGVSVAGAGDVNGDGFSDVIVGASFYANGEQTEGRAYVYHGSATGLSLVEDWSAESNVPGALFGSSVSTAGDVNGDGFSDVIIGASAFGGLFREGRAYVYHGSSTGLELVESWTAQSNQTLAFFGSSVACAGDVNGDGFSDVIVGSPLFNAPIFDEGQASVYHGSAAGLSSIEDWSVSGSAQADFLGGSVAGAGDVNGDGFDDVLVSAVGVDNVNNNEGAVFVYHGSASGLSSVVAWSAEEVDQDFGGLGSSVSSAGDINADGFGDVVVGASGYDNGETDEGIIFVYHGSTSGLELSSAWSVESDQEASYFGIAASSAGDVNGDGFPDLIVGACNRFDGLDKTSSAFVYHGFPMPDATGGSFNGSGVNPTCLASELVLIGDTWDSAVDTSVRPGATFSLLVGQALTSSGVILAGGELLLDLTSSAYFILQATAGGAPTAYARPIPNDPCLAGISGAAQAIVFGAGYTLCNGYAFTIGY